ncbi:MAG: hypothetical protein ACFNVO_07895, partial [Prevotella sp.]
MDANEFTLSLFTTRLRQLLLQYKELEKKNAELQTMIDERGIGIWTYDDIFTAIVARSVVYHDVYAIGFDVRFFELLHT